MNHGLSHRRHNKRILAPILYFKADFLLKQPSTFNFKCPSLLLPLALLRSFTLQILFWSPEQLRLHHDVKDVVDKCNDNIKINCWTAFCESFCFCIILQRGYLNFLKKEDKKRLAGAHKFVLVWWPVVKLNHSDHSHPLSHSEGEIPANSPPFSARYDLLAAVK